MSPAGVSGEVLRGHDRERGRKRLRISRLCADQTQLLFERTAGATIGFVRSPAIEAFGGTIPIDYESVEVPLRTQAPQIPRRDACGLT
jgi:hypothetical protein